jgi:hypothetical protein
MFASFINIKFMIKEYLFISSKIIIFFFNKKKNIIKEK